jgi:hypothetical protein
LNTAKSGVVKLLRINLASLLVVVTAALSAAQPNPSGDCAVSSDGSRLPYHYAANAVWLPDCRNPLRREYWRVFLRPTDTSSASVIPRPDGAPGLGAICSDPTHELRPLVDKYPLCQPAATQEQVRIVNAMVPFDALQITHFLHRQLKFAAVHTTIPAPGGGTARWSAVRPYPIPSDIADACALKKSTGSATFHEKCRSIMDNLKIGLWRSEPVWIGDEAEELASRLNEIYGVQ